MTEPETPRAAMIIAAYNAEATIARAIGSALAQPEVAEVCVVDDASTDATLDVARACDPGDGRLVVLAREANAGPAAARNAGISATSAPWIGVLDADDYLLEGRTAALLAHAEDADIVADDLLRVADEDAPPRALWADESAAPRTVDFEAFVRGNLRPEKGSLELGFLKPLIRRSFLESRELGYRPEMRLGEDYELYARALALGARMRLAPAAGYVSVARAGSLSFNHSETDLQRLRDCDDALARIRPLSAAERRALRRHAESVDCRLQWRLLINAVKARDLRSALKTFRSPATAAYLAVRLGEQAWLRGLAPARSGARALRPARRAGAAKARTSE